MDEMQGNRGFVVFQQLVGRSGVSAERRRMKKAGKCLRRSADAPLRGMLLPT